MAVGFPKYPNPFSFTQHVFSERFGPRMSGVWDRAASRTKHLFKNSTPVPVMSPLAALPVSSKDTAQVSTPAPEAAPAADSEHAAAQAAARQESLQAVLDEMKVAEQLASEIAAPAPEAVPAETIEPPAENPSDATKQGTDQVV